MKRSFLMCCSPTISRNLLTYWFRFFSPIGPPTFYIPMSFQSLEIRTLRTKQKVDCRQQAWWFCDKTKRTNSSSVPVDAVQCTHTKDSDLRPAVKIMTFLDIQREVTAARSPQSPIPPFVMKTSQTHPIKYVFLIF